MLIMDDCFHRFFERFERGEMLSAIQQIVPNPDIAYETLESKEPFFQYLINYVDASVFHPIWWLRFANLSLFRFMSDDKVLSTRYPVSLSLLAFEQKMLEAMTLEDASFAIQAPSTVSWAICRLLRCERDGIAPTPEEIQHALQDIPYHYRQRIIDRLALLRGWGVFKQRKPELHVLWKNKAVVHLYPWSVLQYPLEAASVTIPSKGIPLVFLEPIQGGFSSVLEPLSQRPALFVFETFETFFQMLQYPDVLESLCAPHHLIFILELYPHDQFAGQDIRLLQSGSFIPVLLTKRKRIEEALPVLTAALTDYFKQDSAEAADWLYHAAKRTLFCIEEDRYGRRRTAALTHRMLVQNWYDPHKGLPPLGKALGPTPENYFEQILSYWAQQRHKRPYQPTGKIRLAHVFSGVVDPRGHAPSQILRNLILLHDANRFDLTLVITELHHFHQFEYPYNFGISDPSVLRGRKTLNAFQSLGVRIHILKENLTYEAAATVVSAVLHQDQIDAVVFHGPDVINSVCTQMTEVPLRVLFEHGTQPSFPGFDAVIVSTADAAEIHRGLFQKLHTEVEVLPFCMDIRAQWNAPPKTKAELGFPEDSQLLTTISNHLGTRLSKGMLQAIAEILQRVPNAFYAPIGHVAPEKETEFKQFFREHGVDDRVTFLGRIPNPSQTARTMTLYLNEFPFGSCMSLLDAMAAGCPVVTMYDAYGPQQARYGGEYYGIDRAITSGDVKQYVDLTCRLLTDPEMYREWSDHALKEYEKRSDAAAYVKKFEAIVSGKLKVMSDEFSGRRPL